MYTFVHYRCNINVLFTQIDLQYLRLFVCVYGYKIIIDLH